MTGQQLLERLQKLRDQGTDLSTLDVVVGHTVYEGWGGTPTEGESYPDEVEVVNTFNVLKLF